MTLVLHRKAYVGWLFLGPTVILHLTFLWGPLANTFGLAFTNADTIGGGQFVGTENFTRLANDSEFWRALGISAVYAAGVVPVTVVFALALAMLLNTQLPGTGVLRTAVFSPVVTPIVVVALSWGWVLGSNGLLNAVLARLQLITEPVPWLNQPATALISLMAVTIWKSVGFYGVIYLTALQNVPRELLEAAQVDGAGWLRRVRNVVLPQIVPTTILVAALSGVAAVRAFTEPYVITGGGPYGSTRTVVFYLFERGISPGTDAGYASAISLCLFLLIVVLAGVGQLAVGRRK